MSLLEILKDQSAFGFTGKINVLIKSSGQFYGVIYQNEGNIVDAHVHNLRGMKALYRLIFQDVETDDYLKYVVEPELISEENLHIKISFEDLKKETEANFNKYLNSKKLRPPNNIKLVIDPEVIVSNDQITTDEFDILTLLSEWCLVSDIYKYSNLMDFEITNALVTLRKKKAIKVFQS